MINTRNEKPDCCGTVNIVEVLMKQTAYSDGSQFLDVEKTIGFIVIRKTAKIHGKHTGA